jgi:hypothetical protein
LEDNEDLNGAAQTVEEVMVSEGELNGFERDLFVANGVQLDQSVGNEVKFELGKSLKHCEYIHVNWVGSHSQKAHCFNCHDKRHYFVVCSSAHDS